MCSNSQHNFFANNIVEKTNADFFAGESQETYFRFIPEEKLGIRMRELAKRNIYSRYLTIKIRSY
jgi:hypothetical protein